MDKVAMEVAIEEFERLAAAADVDIDTSNMDDEDKESVEEIRDIVVQAIQAGRLTVDAQGRAVLVTSDGASITFRTPVGADLMILGSSREDKRMESMARFVCAITGESSRVIDKLGKRDWKLALRLAGFLAAD